MTNISSTLALDWHKKNIDYDIKNDPLHNKLMEEHSIENITDFSLKETGFALEEIKSNSYFSIKEIANNTISFLSMAFKSIVEALSNFKNKVFHKIHNYRAEHKNTSHVAHTMLTELKKSEH